MHKQEDKNAIRFTRGGSLEWGVVVIGGAVWRELLELFKIQKHKEEKAKLQERINELQRLLKKAQEREKDLIMKIAQLQRKRKIADRMPTRSKYKNSGKRNPENLRSINKNHSRFKDYRQLLFREKQLLAKIEDLNLLLCEKEQELDTFRNSLQQNEEKIVHIDKQRGKSEGDLEAARRILVQHQAELEKLEKAVLK